MQNYTQLEDLVFSFCQKHQIGLIQPDKNMHFVLYIDRFEVRCFTSRNELYQISEVLTSSRAQAGSSANQLKQLMQNALLAWETSSCSLSLSEDKKLYVVQRLLFSESSLTHFETSVADLANQVEYFSDLSNHQA